MNILNITKSLHERINSATSLDEILILTKTIERLNLGTVKTVSNYSDLLLEYPQEGEVYFVENEEQLYYGFNGLWYLIFRTATTIAYGWGRNSYYGELGTNDTTDRSSPVSVVGGFTDWTSVKAVEHSIGLRANGTLWSWGRNSYGQLGTNNTLGRSSPVSVVGGFTDWVLINTGRRHVICLRANRTAWTWGFNNRGQLGDNTISNRSSPVSVLGGFTDWISVSGCYDSSFGLRSNGTMWAWGLNVFGQLGDGTTISRRSPVSVVGGFTWKTLFTAGGDIVNFTGAVKTDGTLWVWGNNFNGQLGTNNTSSRSSPVSVVGGFTDWIAASCGNIHVVGLRANGTLWAWGNNSSGQLGDNTTSNRSSPVSVVGGFNDWITVSCGNAHAVGLRANGTAWTWGYNGKGQLGTNNTSNRSSPVSVVGGFTDWVSASAAMKYTLGIRSTT